MEIFLICLMSYAIGSIPTAFIVGKLNNIDIRQHGSGNVGATNVYRVLGKKWGSITFVFDFLKGFIPTYISTKFFLNPYMIMLIGFLSIAGHIFTLFLSSKGGKGVATSAGVLMVITPYALALALITFILITKSSGFVSLGTITATFVFMISSILFHIKPEFRILCILISIIIFITHIPNIKRLLKGEELKYNRKEG
ncbi:MAG: glycerol-3-phosphate 1-O-acyltransferase PlsY [Elusimicrobiota bacterium]